MSSLMSVGFCARGEQWETFPFFCNYVQPSCFAWPFRQSFLFGFFWAASLRRSSRVRCSQHRARTNQDEALVFLSARTSLVRSARPRCTPANLCDVMEAGASNASRRGRMWHLYVIDKLQLSLCEERGEFRIGSTHNKTKELIR